MTDFPAPTRAAVDRCHALALEHGGRNEGDPGLRPECHPNDDSAPNYEGAPNHEGAYVRDPDGNKLCVVCHHPQRQHCLTTDRPQPDCTARTGVPTNATPSTIPPMTPFRCIPIETQTAERFRRTGHDDRDNPIRRLTAPATGAPCRHCLRLAHPGEAVLLGSYDLPRPHGIYWTPSPIFVHDTACPRAETDNEIAPIVRANALVSLRAYDAADQCLYDLGHVCPGLSFDDPLERALADPRTAFVNIHTARPGCLLSRVERLPLPLTTSSGAP